MIKEVGENERIEFLRKLIRRGLLLELYPYRGYSGSIELSDDDSILYGRIKVIEDLVSYEGTNLMDLEAAFKQAVDSYLRTQN